MTRTGPERRVAILTSVELNCDRQILCGMMSYARNQTLWEVRCYASMRGILPRIQSWNPDGVISQSLAGPSSDQMRGLESILVRVADSLSHRGPCLDGDWQAVGKLGAQHLLQRGLSHFGWVSAPNQSGTRQREEGFTLELKRCGFSCDCFYRTNTNSRRQGLSSWLSPDRRLGRWLLDLPKPAGVMAYNDVHARMIIQQCQEVGLRVPLDVAVLGVDNDYSWCEMCPPEISSVEIPWTSLGYAAAQLLDRLMRGSKPPARPILISPSSVVSRTSTHVLATDDADLQRAFQLIREQACNGMDIKQILQHVPISRRKLERQFAAVLGCTPHQEIMKIRLERAKRLLRGTNIRIGDIARQCGFSPERFSIMFRTMTGTTAMDYRHAGHKCEHNTA